MNTVRGSQSYSWVTAIVCVLCRNMGVRASRERAREAEILAARLHLYGEFDTVIKCEDTEMPCHREVLMEHSAYFR